MLAELLFRKHSMKLAQRLPFVILPLVIGITTNQAGEPQVLIIGDSISLGYTPFVVESLKDEARVVHNKGNAQHSGTGLKKIDEWLGDTKWDVIHFNWGLWDLCYRHPESKVQGNRDKVHGTLTTDLANYEQNLEELTARLKQTGAQLIWGSTTVVPEDEAGRKVDDDLRYNEAAARVMAKHNVRINDLNQLSRTFAPAMFTQPGDVHFKSGGYQQLASQVAASIRGVLQKNSQKPLRRILLGSCIKQNDPAPIFETINNDNPDLFIFLGDNMYADTENMNVLKAQYKKLQQLPGFEKLRSLCPVLATWDDHDFGVNDGGASYRMRKESRDVFLDFWRPNTPATATEGIYDAQLFGPEEKRVQIILLDTRYFRSPLTKGDKRVGGSWTPDTDPSKTILGQEQWKWLEDQLRQPAKVRIIVSSIQFVAEDAGQEAWANLPLERQRMIQLLRKTNAEGVVFVSGDRHWSELSALQGQLNYPLFDLTCSSLNQVHLRGTPTQNKYRYLPNTFHQPNYGVISIDWQPAKPGLMLEIKDVNGKSQLQHSI